MMHYPNPLLRSPLKKVAMLEDIASQVVVISSSTVMGDVTGQVTMVTAGKHEYVGLPYAGRIEC